MEIKDMLELTHLEGLTEEELLEQIAQAKDDLEEAIDDAMKVIQAATAKLTEIHFADA